MEASCIYETSITFLTSTCCNNQRIELASVINYCQSIKSAIKQHCYSFVINIEKTYVALPHFSACMSHVFIVHN